jgi:hypothetical protein
MYHRLHTNRHHRKLRPVIINSHHRPGPHRPYTRRPIDGVDDPFSDAFYLD